MAGYQPFSKEKEEENETGREKSSIASFLDLLNAANQISVTTARLLSITRGQGKKKRWSTGLGYSRFFALDTQPREPNVICT